jgi:hypothetical protein
MPLVHVAVPFAGVPQGEHAVGPQPYIGSSVPTHIPMQSFVPDMQPVLLLLLPGPPALPLPPPLVVVVAWVVAVVVAVVPPWPAPPVKGERPDVGNPQAPVQITAQPSAPRTSRADRMRPSSHDRRRLWMVGRGALSPAAP